MASRTTPPSSPLQRTCKPLQPPLVHLLGMVQAASGTRRLTITVQSEPRLSWRPSWHTTSRFPRHEFLSVAYACTGQDGATRRSALGETRFLRQERCASLSLTFNQSSFFSGVAAAPAVVVVVLVLAGGHSIERSDHQPVTVIVIDAAEDESHLIGHQSRCSSARSNSLLSLPTSAGEAEGVVGRNDQRPTRRSHRRHCTMLVCAVGV